MNTQRSSRKAASTTRPTKRRRSMRKKWVRTVRTDSTHPPRGTFTGSAQNIARTMARKDVSPGGLSSAIKMIQYFINRGGKNVSASRRAELERAKRLLQKRVQRHRAASARKRKR
ncbi:MAG TPA: DUF3175 domain-containing protein [Vicinamibacterales bacterium]|nr:DUF3175 domain-containing protein [Vicinamibacterales bacterium]